MTMGSIQTTPTLMNNNSTQRSHQEEFGWTEKRWVIFGVGKRIYHVWFNRSLDCKTLKYGACIFKNSGKDDLNKYDGVYHLTTAYERFKNFGVEVNIRDKSFQEFLSGVRTRMQCLKFYESKKFERYLIKCFVAYGVRARNGKETYTSLKEKEFDYRKAKIKKNIKMIRNKTTNDIARKKKVYSSMCNGYFESQKSKGKSWSFLGNEDDINEDAEKVLSGKTITGLYWSDMGRTYHIVIQHDCETGFARYGACILKTDTGLLEKTQDMLDSHFETAKQRFTLYPIYCIIPIEYNGSHHLRYITRGEFKFTRSNIEVLHKTLCMFGVRQRGNDDHPLIGRVRLMNKMLSDIKKWRRIEDELQKEIGSHKRNKNTIVCENEEIVILKRSDLITDSESMREIQENLKIKNSKRRNKDIYSKRIKKLRYREYTNSRVIKEKRKANKTRTKR